MGERKLTLQITQAKLYILDKTYNQFSIDTSDTVNNFVEDEFHESVRLVESYGCCTSEQLTKLEKRVRESIHRAFKYIPDSSKSDRDAQYLCDTLTLLDTISPTSDACRPPALSPVEVGQGGILYSQTQGGDKKSPPVLSLVNCGQGGTIVCMSCNGLGIDKLDMSPCDDCAGTGRQVFQILDHDSYCQCLSCLPYGPGLEPVFQKSDYEGVL